MTTALTHGMLRAYNMAMYVLQNADGYDATAVALADAVFTITGPLVLEATAETGPLYCDCAGMTTEKHDPGIHELGAWGDGPNYNPCGWALCPPALAAHRRSSR
jgi:hypothetical protein